MKDEMELKYESEKNIVDRCWERVGIASYKDAGGKSIYELITGHITRADIAEAEIASLRAERGRLREALNYYATEGNGSEMWSRCRICKELSSFDPTTAREIFTHKSDCLLAQETK
jgi:hypothetical protein